MSCNGIAKEKPFAKLYCRYFYNILSEFCFNGVSMGRYQIKWLLSSRKVAEVQALDSGKGRKTKQMKVVKLIKCMIGI